MCVRGSASFLNHNLNARQFNTYIPHLRHIAGRLKESSCSARVVEVLRAWETVRPAFHSGSLRKWYRVMTVSVWDLVTESLALVWYPGILEWGVCPAHQDQGSLVLGGWTGNPWMVARLYLALVLKELFLVLGNQAWAFQGLALGKPWLPGTWVGLQNLPKKLIVSLNHVYGQHSSYSILKQTKNQTFACKYDYSLISHQFFLEIYCYNRFNTYYFSSPYINGLLP